ncbi:MAG: hypothetical protein ONB05_12450, partial [candidate division KSB1 bacterium]|nr:hypothetical protein [candidate division KSB1 bacterium]
TQGLNGWHIECYEMDWTLVASRTTYTHWRYGAGYYSGIMAPTRPPSECSWPSTPRYRVILYDNNWTWRMWYDGVYLCPATWRWYWIWSWEDPPYIVTGCDYLLCGW